jgi:hypothetical protein
MFECCTGTIPSCPLLQADKAKAAKAIDKAPKCNAGTDAQGMGLVTPDPKCQQARKSGNTMPSSNAAPSADDLSGMLIYTGTDDAHSQCGQPCSAPLCSTTPCGTQLPPRQLLHDNP